MRGARCLLTTLVAMLLVLTFSAFDTPVISSQGVSGQPPVAPGQRGQPLPATGTAFIAGQVVDQTSGRGVAGVTVYLLGGTGSRPERPVLADSQGRFFFSALPAMAYRLVPVKEGHFELVPGARVEVADGERFTNLKVRLARFAVVEGTVRDDAGEPVPGVEVLAFQRVAINGRPVFRTSSRSRTDDRGVYRLERLLPGELVVCACGRDPMPFDGTLLTALAAEPFQLLGVTARALRVGADVASLDSTLRTIAPTFHPSSATVARAARIPIASGDEKTAIDIDVTPARATRVSGTIVGAPGPVNASSIRLVPAGDVDEGLQIPQLAPILVQPGGRFDFAGVPPGPYVLRVMHTPRAPGAGAPTGAALTFLGGRAAMLAGPPSQLLPNEPVMWAFEPVTVGEDGVAGLTVALKPAGVVAGRLQFAGAPPPPSPQVRLSVTLQSLDVSRPATATSAVASDGTFQVLNVLPGRYAIRRSGSIPPSFNLKSVTVGGQDVTDMPVDVGIDGLKDVVITMADAPLASLNGMVVDGRAGPAPESLVFAFPTDRRYWVELDASTRRFQNAPVSRTGAYSTTGLPAGEYFVVVVPLAVVADWQVSGIPLDSLARTATRIQLADGEKKIVDVRR